MKLSIVIVFCNKDANFVKNRIDEIHKFFSKETYEIVLMDNRKDKSNFIKFEEDIKVIPIEKSGNFQPLQFKARLLSLDYCSGDYVWFVDPDDNIIENNFDEIIHGINQKWDIVTFSLYRDNEPVFLDTNITFVSHAEDLLCLPKNFIFQFYEGLSYSSWNKWYKLDMLKSAVQDAGPIIQDCDSLAMLEDVLFDYITLYNSKNLKYLKNYYIYNYHYNDSNIIGKNLVYDNFARSILGVYDFKNICNRIFTDRIIESLSIDKTITANLCSQVIRLAQSEDRITAKQCYDYLRDVYPEITPDSILTYTLLYIDQNKINAVLTALHKLDSNIKLQLISSDTQDVTINTFNFFGYLEQHPIAQACIESWKQKMPNAKIKIWTFDELKDTILSYGFTRFAYKHQYYTFLGDITRLFLAMSTPNFLYLDLDTFIEDDLTPLLSEYNSLTLGFSTESNMIRTNFGCILWQRDFCNYVFSTFQKYLLPEYEEISSVEFLEKNDACTFSEDIAATAYDYSVNVQLVDDCAVIHDNELNKYCKHVGLSILNPLTNINITSFYYSMYNPMILNSLTEWSNFLHNKGINCIYIIKADSHYITKIGDVEFRFVILPSHFSDEYALDLVCKDIVSSRNNRPIKPIVEPFDNYWRNFNGI